MDPGGAEEASAAEEIGEEGPPQLEQLSSPTVAEEGDEEDLEAGDLEEADVEDEHGELIGEDDGEVEETDENIEEEEDDEVPQDELGEEETEEGFEEEDAVATLQSDAQVYEEHEDEEEEDEDNDKPLEEEDMEEDGDEEDDPETDDGAGPPGAQETNNNNKEDQEKQEGAVLTRKRSASQSSTDEGPKRKQGRSASAGGSKHDEYCWSCHKDGVQAFCKICPRSFHFKCMHLPDEQPLVKGQGQVAEPTSKSCICPECAVVMNAENLETRSEAMKQLTVDQLITMLKNACQRMKSTPQAEPFLLPVDQDEAVDYSSYVVYPMDLTTLEKNVKQRQYGSTEAFLADAQWLVHNSIVFNSASSPFTATAKKILKTCKQEIQEIETCPECYVNAHHKPESWFIEACKRPHILVWAKLKGFPFWPAKAMKIKDDMVDVRFFGQHDRAWVCLKDCFLYSEEMPGSAPKRNNQLLAAIEELNGHIQKLKESNGPFIFASAKTPIGPELSLEQIRKMLPEFKPDGPTQKNVSQVAKMEIQQQPKVKSPMTIRISSLKTNPTIVNSTVTDEPINNKPTLRIRKSKAPGSSNAESSSDESQRKADVEITEEKDDDTKQEQKEEIPEVKEALAVTGKGSEILASALGLSRVTRRSSRSENTSPAASTVSTDQSILNGEKRPTRSVQKTLRSSESGEESKEEAPIAPPPPPDAFLQSLGLGLRKTSDVKNASSTASPSMNAAGKLHSHTGVVIKGEPEDLPEPDEEMDDSSGDAPLRAGGVGVKTQELMNQISGSNKPGLRFNLSKDISISPVGEDSGSGKVDLRPRKPMMPGSNSARMPPGLIPQSIHMQLAGMRPRPVGNSNGAMGNQRLMAQRPLTRPLRPGVQLRPGMKMSRPVNHQMQMRPQGQGQGHKPKDPNSPIVVESSSLRIDGQAAFTTSSTGTVQMNQVQSMQGAITLPGGTITVTPLTPLIGVPITTYGSGDGNVNGGHVLALKTNQTGLGLIQHNIATTSVTTANGLPISVISPHDGNQPQQHKSKPAAQQRRNLMNQIPPSVGHMVQNLQKSLLDLVKTTMENIVIEIVENAPGLSGATELKTLKQENEKLQKQAIDFKHNQDIALREVKMAMETDKKRTVSELRRQFEHEKLKAVDETKKKQWCARCNREAQFYCCWNTSYCGYGCQEEHWPSHMSSCSQASGSGGPR